MTNDQNKKTMNGVEAKGLVKMLNMNSHLLRVCGKSLRLGIVGLGITTVDAQQPVSRYYTAPGNYGTSYGAAGYGAVRTYSQFPSPGYGRGLRPYAVAQNQWGSGIWNQAAQSQVPAQYHVQPPAGRYQTWAAPYRGQAQQAQQQLPPIGAYAPTVGPGYGTRRATAY